MTPLKPWMLPLIVVGLIAPLALGLALLGPQGMVFAAVLVGIVLVIAVSLPRKGRTIEVAGGGEGRHHALIAATGPIEEPGHAEEVAARIRRRAREGTERDPDVLVVAPALNPTLDHWAVDVAGARRRAASLLETSLARLSSAGLEARGSVGDSNPILAVEDALRVFPADEVVVVEGEDADGKLTAELRERLDRPVEAVPAGHAYRS